MWTGTALLSELDRRAEWRVEFFADAAAPPRSAYPCRPLRDLVEERRESLDPQARPEERFHYLGLENVASVMGELVSVIPRAGREIRSRSKVFAPGDVLYARLRPYLNKVYLAEPPVDRGICSGEFFVLIPRAQIVRPRFLRALLSSRLVQEQVCRCQRGATRPRLQLRDLLGIEVPVPALAEQEPLEAFLIERTRRLRELAAELAELPRRTLDELTRALEYGEREGLRETTHQPAAPARGQK
jgi:restriction endonuclease S subunit